MDIDPEKLALMAVAGSAGKKAIAWLWGIYGKKLTERVGDAAKEKWEEFKWDKAAEAYRGKIKKLYGTMQIMGMAEPVPLDDIFTDAYMRSEEHTSELQSRSDLVCRLLLEKKNKYKVHTL